MKTILDSDIKFEDFKSKDKKPIQLISGADIDGDLWDFGHSQEELDEEIKSEGFVYKCIADNGSNHSQGMGFAFSMGRNIIDCILKMKPFGHLGSDIITIRYPEVGLSPKDQAAFVYNCTRHPDWHMVKELRIITRNPFFISDCKSTFCRIITPENIPTSVDKSEYYIPEVRKDYKRLYCQRKDFTLSKPDRLYTVFLWGAKERCIAMYVGECDNFVYWIDGIGKGYKLKRTPHREFWFDLNALWIDSMPIETFREAESMKWLTDEIKKYVIENNKVENKNRKR